MLVAEGLHVRPVIHTTPVGPVRVLVVDDHEVLRSGLRWLLTRVGWVEGCAVAASGEEALALAASGAFDVALVDVDLGAECGLALAERLVSGPIVGLLASRWDLVSPRTARGAGARGVIAKDRPARALLAAVHELAAGGSCQPSPGAPGGLRFVPREREILRLVSAGLTNAEIGAALFLAPGTIKHHMLGLYEKLGAPNRAAAVHAARRLGVLTDHRVEEPVSGAPGGARRRVLVADPDDLRRTGLLLALHGGVGARDVTDALAVAARLRPEVAVAGDEELSGALRAAGVPTLLVRDDEVDAGEPGVVRQWWPAARIAAACDAAPVGDADRSCGAHASVGLLGLTPSSPSLARGCRPAAGSGGDRVSPREHDVLSALAAGATNPAIARALGLSTNTVKQHASSIFRKLGARNRAEAVRLADDLGLI